MTGEQYRRYPKSLLMRQVSVDARDKNNRAEQFKVVTTMLDASIDGGQIGDLYERRWSGEVDIRSIKSTMQMDVLRCKSPEMVHKEIWAHLLAYNLLRTVMAVAAAEVGIEPREVSFKGAKQAVTAFAPKIEAARPEDRPALIDGAAGGDRLPPRRRPSGAVGAAGAEAPAEAGGLPARTASRDQTGEGSLEMVLKLVPFVRRHRRVPQPGRASNQQGAPPSWLVSDSQGRRW